MFKFVKIGMLLVSVSLVVACQNMSAVAQTRATESVKKTYAIEGLYSIQRLEDSLLIDVMTRGCTKADDFSLTTKLIKENYYQLSVIRKMPDKCKALPRLKRFALKLPTFLIEEKTKFSVSNPISYFKPTQRVMPR